MVQFITALPSSNVWGKEVFASEDAAQAAYPEVPWSRLHAEALADAARNGIGYSKEVPAPGGRTAWVYQG